MPCVYYGKNFCIYTHEDENAFECSFYGRVPSHVELDNAVKRDSDSGESTKYQDIDRTFMSGERQLENRRDCRNLA